MHNEIQISMHTWRSPMSATSQGAFVVIPEISHGDISYIIKNGAEDEIRTRDPRLGKAMLYP